MIDLNIERLNDPRVLALSDSVFRFHVAALSHCATYDTDGFISEASLRVKFSRIRIASHVNALTAPGAGGAAALWLKCEHGWNVSG